MGINKLPPEMDPYFYQWLLELIKADNVLPFYHTREWKRVRLKVLELDHRECQECRAKGIYERATLVHHVIELRVRPDLALSIFYEGKRQLISLSDPCHEIVHEHRHSQPEPLTPERW